MFAAIAATIVALGVGATDSNSIVVRIDGKETPIKLAGVAAGSERGAAFVKCLVAERVVRVSGPRSAATVTMLDDTSVAAHVAEFLQTTTSSDPCAIGRAAYQPVRVTAKPSAPAAKHNAAVVIVPSSGTKKREGRVSFGSSKNSSGKYDNETLKVPPPGTSNEWANNYRPPAPPPAPSNQPTYAAPPTIPTYQPGQAQTYTPPTARPDNNLSQGQTQTMPQQGTQPMEQHGVEPVPTTTYERKPPQ